MDKLETKGKYTSNEMQIGKAGEYLVCADLIMKGFVAYPSEQGLPYDVVLDTGNRLLKVQVKTTSGPKKTPQRNTETYSYIFDLSRHGSGNKGIYQENEADIFALVTLDTKNVGYVKKEDFRKNLTFRVDSLRGNYYDEKGIQHYKEVMKLRKNISNQSEIARITGLHVSTVNRMCKKDFTPYKSNAKYFSDIIREKEWFVGM